MWLCCCVYGDRTDILFDSNMTAKHMPDKPVIPVMPVILVPGHIFALARLLKRYVLSVLCLHILCSINLDFIYSITSYVCSFGVGNVQSMNNKSLCPRLKRLYEKNPRE